MSRKEPCRVLWFSFVRVVGNVSVSVFPWTAMSLAAWGSRKMKNTIKSLRFRNRTVLWYVQECTLTIIHFGFTNSSSPSMCKFITSHDVNHILNSSIISSRKPCPQPWSRIFVWIIYDTLLNHVVFCPIPSMVLLPVPMSQSLRQGMHLYEILAELLPGLFPFWIQWIHSTAT